MINRANLNLGRYYYPDLKPKIRGVKNWVRKALQRRDERINHDKYYGTAEENAALKKWIQDDIDAMKGGAHE